jgi:hypothetical protein
MAGVYAGENAKLEVKMEGEARLLAGRGEQCELKCRRVGSANGGDVLVSDRSTVRYSLSDLGR